MGDVITGDEAWFYWRQSGKKQSNKSWVGEGEKAREVVRIGRFEPKNLFILFFRASGIVHISYLDKGKTINHQTYIKDCLEPLVGTLKEQRPICGTGNLKFLTHRTLLLAISGFSAISRHVLVIIKAVKV